MSDKATPKKEPPYVETACGALSSDDTNHRCNEAQLHTGYGDHPHKCICGAMWKVLPGEMMGRFPRV